MGSLFGKCIQKCRNIDGKSLFEKIKILIKKKLFKKSAENMLKMYFFPQEYCSFLYFFIKNYYFYFYSFINFFNFFFFNKYYI